MSSDLKAYEDDRTPDEVLAEIRALQAAGKTVPRHVARGYVSPPESEAAVASRFAEELARNIARNPALWRTMRECRELLAEAVTHAERGSPFSSALAFLRAEGKLHLARTAQSDDVADVDAVHRTTRLVDAIGTSLREAFAPRGVGDARELLREAGRPRVDPDREAARAVPVNVSAEQFADRRACGRSHNLVAASQMEQDK